MHFTLKIATEKTQPLENCNFHNYKAMSKQAVLVFSEITIHCYYASRHLLLGKIKMSEQDWAHWATTAVHI
jgi:hypothetical protein